MSIPSRIGNAIANSPLNSLHSHLYKEHLSLELFAPSDMTHREVCEVLFGYLFNNSIYEILNLDTGGENPDKVLGLRNPVSAFVGFYLAKLFPDPLEPLPTIAEDNPTQGDALKAAILEIWKRSKLDENKDLAATYFPLLGEMPIEANQLDSGFPFLDVINPRDLTEVDKNPRGFLEWARVDYPYTERNPETGKTTERMFTRVWSQGRIRTWRYDKVLGANQSLDELPTGDSQGVDYQDLDYRNGSLLVEFIPIAYATFLAVDHNRGFSPLLTALEVIDESNSQATRLASLFFRNEEDLGVLQANYVGQDGRPAAPPMVGSPNALTEVTFPNGKKIVSLGGNSTYQSTVPNLNYAEGRGMLDDTLSHLRNFLLPELNYNVTDSSNDESGKSRRYRLAPALDRAMKARQRGSDCLIRATYMALTLGQLAFGKSSDDKYKAAWKKATGKDLDVKALAIFDPNLIGTYDAGDWDFILAPSEILPLTLEEQATIASQLATTFSAKGAVEAAQFPQQLADMLLENDGEVIEQ